MPKLPIISGKKAITAFRKLGYQVTRQKGSHIRLRHFSDEIRKPLTIPNHKALGKGLLRKLLNDAHLTRDDFLKLIK